MRTVIKVLLLASLTTIITTIIYITWAKTNSLLAQFGVYPRWLTVDAIVCVIGLVVTVVSAVVAIVTW